MVQDEIAITGPQRFSDDAESIGSRRCTERMKPSIGSARAGRDKPAPLGQLRRIAFPLGGGNAHTEIVQYAPERRNAADKSAEKTQIGDFRGAEASLIDQLTKFQRVPGLCRHPLSECSARMRMAALRSGT